MSARKIGDLPQGARVGTGSLRRRAQLLALRPDLHVQGIRGNIDTRLRKLKNGDFDAVILAMAGIKRAGLFDSDLMTPIEYDEFLPAAGQGALSIQCRRDNRQVRDLAGVLHHEPTASCVQQERELVRLLEGDCFSPIAAFASIVGKELILRSRRPAQWRATPAHGESGSGPRIGSDGSQVSV